MWSDLATYSEQKLPRPKLFSKFEFVLMIVDLSLFVLAVVLVLVARSIGSANEYFNDLRFAALLALLLVQVSGFLMVLVGIWPSVKLIRGIFVKPVRSFIMPSLLKTQRDYDYAASLSIYPEDSLGSLRAGFVVRLIT